MICQGLTREQCNELYLEVLNDEDTKALKTLCKEDLFFLLSVAFKRKDINRDWLFERCREVEANPDGHLDLWARDHYKSTIITFGKSIQDILINPDITIGIFSHTRPIAKGFLEQIKRELEDNAFLKGLFPEILYTNPRTEAPKWSLDSGIIVKRNTNPKEATVEAWGLVDGQPTGKHFKLRVYDDVVTRESVTTPEQIQKTTSAWELSQNLGSGGGRQRYIGTRYHINDTYRTMMDRESVVARIHPATDDGKATGNAVFIDTEILNIKRRDMGPYTFACFPAGSPVTMSDWKEKPIELINIGDSVVGYSLEKGKKSKLVSTKVVAINKRIADVIEAKFESGRVIRCTPDHKWFTGRRGKDIGGTDTHKTYLPLGFDKNSTKGLISIYDPRNIKESVNELEAGWLAGIFDGEGSTSGKSIHIHQTIGKNKPVCDRLEKCLNILGFDYGFSEISRNKKHTTVRDYFIKGGREAQIKFLRVCNPARSYKIIDIIFQNGTRNFGKTKKDKLISIDNLGAMPVYNIQTETGNYVSYGYATKNCQMLQDPVADKSMSFKAEWLSYYDQLGDTKRWNKYIIVDPASKKKSTSDFTVMEVIALATDGNYYLIDAVRDRLNLTQRAAKLFELHRKHNPKGVGYEQYGMQADIEHIQYQMEQLNYRFTITELKGNVAKEDRIKKLIPIFDQRRFYLPRRLQYVDYEGRVQDFIKLFLDNEYLAFPVCVHDDMLDCMARIIDPMFNAEFPKQKPTEDPKTPIYVDSTFAQGWMG